MVGSLNVDEENSHSICEVNNKYEGGIPPLKLRGCSSTQNNIKSYRNVQSCVCVCVCDE